MTEPSDISNPDVAPEARWLANGHAFARAWEEVRGVERFGLLRKSRRREMLRSAAVVPQTQPDAREMGSHRYRVGRALDRTQRSLLPALPLVPGLVAAGWRSRRGRAARLRAREVDIGLHADPLVLFPNADREALEHRRRTLQTMSANIDTLAARAETPFSGPLLYLSGMAWREVPSGYGHRTHTIVEALRNHGMHVDLVHLGINKDGGRDGDVTTCIGQDGDLEDLVDKAVASTLQRASGLGTHTVASGSNWLAGMVGLRVARELGVPFVYDVRGLWAMTRAHADPAYTATLAYRAQLDAEAAVMRAADHVMAISGGVRDWAVARGVEASHISVVPNMTEAPVLPASDRPEDVWSIGYAGSLTDYECLETLLHTLAHTAGRNVASRPLSLWIAGSGPAEGRLRGLAAALSLSDVVTFHGRVPRARVRALMAATHVMAYPRADAPLFHIVPALKPVEAMGAGLAVVASDLAPHRELSGDEGRIRLVSDRAPETWLDALEDVLPASGKIGARAREWTLANRMPEHAMQPWMRLFGVGDA